MLKVTIRYYLFECLPPFVITLLCALFFGLAFHWRIDGLIIACGVGLSIALAWFVVRFRRILMAFWYRGKCLLKVVLDQLKKGVWVHKGGNRTGKSLNGYATLYNKQQAQELHVQRYHSLYHFKKETEKLSPKEYLEFCEMNDFHKFYSRHNYLLPGFVSNIKVTADGRESMELTCRHLAQIDRLPPYCAVGMDESSNKVDNDCWKDEQADRILTDYIRFFNHYLGDTSLFIFMEQNSERAFKGYRDSVQEILTHRGVERLLRPKRLEKKIEKMYERFQENIYIFRLLFFKWRFKKGKYKTTRYAKKILRLENKARKIGVIELRMTTMDEPTVIIKEYLDCDLPFNYDNRFFRTSYLSRDMEIVLSKFDHDLQSVRMVDDYIAIKRIKKEGEKESKAVAYLDNKPLAVLFQEAKTLRTKPPPKPSKRPSPTPEGSRSEAKSPPATLIKNLKVAVNGANLVARPQAQHKDTTHKA